MVNNVEDTFSFKEAWDEKNKLESQFPRWVVLDYANNDTYAVKLKVSYAKTLHYKDAIGKRELEWGFSSKQDIEDLLKHLFILLGHDPIKSELAKYINLTKEGQCSKCYGVFPKQTIKEEVEYYYERFKEKNVIDGPICIDCAKELTELKKQELREKHEMKLEAAKRREEELDKLRYPLLNDIDNMDGYQFQQAFALWLQETKKFDEVTDLSETKKTGDYGADVIGRSGEKKIIFQCKKLFEGVIGVSAIQEVYAANAFYNGDLAVVVTNQRFTAQARMLAAKLNVELWDRNKIIDMISK